MANTSGNVLYYGDNLDVLRRYGRDATVDLIYLDPPFNSNASYSVLFAEADGSRSAAQIEAFEDTWRWDQAARAALDDVIAQGGRPADALDGLHKVLGPSNMLAYLAMMAPRLIELRRVLKPTGSLYLHCDPTASHYLKLLLDSIFGPQNFRNEIVWKRTSGRKARWQFGRVHDTILFYTRSNKATWNAPTVPQTAQTVRGHDLLRMPDGAIFRLSDLTAPETRQGDTGLPWRDIDVTSRGRHWAYFRSDLDRLNAEGRVHWAKGGGMPRLKVPLEQLPGTAMVDVWTDLDPINAAAAERLGFQTQKPEPLLERIIAASSGEGDVVLDPFCGCGTTIAVAQRLGRRWVGIDVTHLAVGLIKTRLTDTFGGGDLKADYTVIGEPMDEGAARQLASDNRFQFQAWALGLVHARRTDSDRPGADRGIDGTLFFNDSTSDAPRKRVVLSVKSGKLKATDVRDIAHVIKREHAALGALISLEVPSAKMRTEAAEMGFYEGPYGRFARLQLLTVADLMAGRIRLEMPPRATHTTFKRASRATAETREADPLF